ncbi:mitochondrial cardiolipin hydrolase-like [Contarinia nasturtii]|uniref:mitochondrial cardiolipin hydrolase-like n=1 Tax=Contarinia nasturtii TaxID=265458 RepID=UPI0012D3E546|nr:mitochondrial cardiolipin hydrolase-like [Contarinia nasturtii]
MNDILRAFIWLVVGIILAFLCKVFYDKFNTRKEDKVYFVMSFDENCCNPFVSNCNPGPQCKKRCPGSLFEKIAFEMKTARSSICIAMYNFTSHRLAQHIALHKGKFTGVNVRVIMDKKTYDDNEEKTEKGKDTVGRILEKAGIHVKTCGDSENSQLMHHKFCLIDGYAREGCLINGSLNWTAGVVNNCENVHFNYNKKVRKEYLHAFDLMWNQIK